MLLSYDFFQCVHSQENVQQVISFPVSQDLKSMASSWNSLSWFSENSIKPIYKIEESGNLP